MKFKNLRTLGLNNEQEIKALKCIKTKSQLLALQRVAGTRAMDWVLELASQGAEFEIRYGTRDASYKTVRGLVPHVPAYSHRVYCGNAYTADEFLIPIPMEGRVWTDDGRSIQEGAWEKAASYWLDAEASPAWVSGLGDEELEMTLRNESEEFFRFSEIMPPEARANFSIRLQYLRTEYDDRRRTGRKQNDYFLSNY